MKRPFQNLGKLFNFCLFLCCYLDRLYEMQVEAPASGGSCKWRNEALSTFDDINNNKIICRYYDRDSRRNYPQTVEFTPSTLKELPIDPNATARTIKEASFKSQGFLDFKYQYKEGKGQLDPTGSAENPDFCIRSVQ